MPTNKSGVKSETGEFLAEKNSVRHELFAKYFPHVTASGPLLLFFEPKEKGHQKVFSQLLEAYLVLPGNAIVIRQQRPTHEQNELNKKMVEVTVSANELTKIMRGADMAVVLEMHQDLEKQLFHEGVIIIGHEKSPFLEDYHPNTEAGNSFVYSEYNPWSVFMAMVRAFETYRFPYDWKHIIRGIFKKLNKS